MAERWNASVDRHVCVRTGLCAATAPDEFDLDENGQGHAKSDTVPASQPVRDAAESCPVEAITLTDPTTGHRIFPPQ
jgi:ferredoxin